MNWENCKKESDDNLVTLFFIDGYHCCAYIISNCFTDVHATGAAIFF